MRSNWRRSAALISLPVLVGALALVAAPVRAQDGDLASHLDMAYVEQVIEDLTSIGSTPLGFRVFGTPQDLESATYVTDQMRALGLRDVALEPVVGDGWLFEGASVEVRGGDTATSYPAASMGGVPGTPPDGLSGRLVFVGRGTAPAYEHLGVDATGKIVLAWWNPDWVWANHVAMQAHAEGAKALILATPEGGAYYQADDALGSFDATCDPDLCVPFVTVSTATAAELVGRLAAGERLRSTVTLDAEILEDATGYNTIGVIPGADDAHPILIGAHHDAWFDGAVDATDGVAATLALAKAVVDSGYEPRHTLVFVTHTGEEYGIADAYYDWLYGAWYRITQEHPEWQTDATAFVNFEGQAPPYRLHVNVVDELAYFVDTQLADAGDRILRGYELFDIYSWNEAFTFGAAGVPSLTFGAFGAGPRSFDRTRYHTQLDTLEFIDLEGLAPVLEAEFALVEELDGRALAPYAFGRRIATLRASVDSSLLSRLGADPVPLVAAIDELGTAWAAYRAADGAAGPTCVGPHLREAVRESLTGLTALSVWDDTIYPQEQVQADAWALGKAIASLRHGRWERALVRLSWVAQMWYAGLLDHEPFAAEMAHHDADSAELAWGGQGKLAPYLDLWEAAGQIRETGLAGGDDFSGPLDELGSARRLELSDLDARLDAMVASIGAVTSELEAAASC
jgi:hypothetical protein